GTSVPTFFGARPFVSLSSFLFSPVALSAASSTFLSVSSFFCFFFSFSSSSFSPSSSSSSAPFSSALSFSFSAPSAPALLGKRPAADCGRAADCRQKEQKEHPAGRLRVLAVQSRCAKARREGAVHRLRAK